jgi:hypothetical protein
MPGWMRRKRRREGKSLETVIARSTCDEAIHSSFVRRHGLLRFARNDVEGHDFAFPRRDAPEVCLNSLAPRKTRAQGMPDARCTRGLVRKLCKRAAHEHTGSAEALRHSLRNGFTAYTRSPRSIGLSCLRRPRIWFCPPGWADKTSADLTPTSEASGPHDFAVRFGAVRQRAV